MFLRNNALWRMSAVRFAVTLCLIFVVVLGASGVYLVDSLRTEIRALIDEDLRATHDSFVAEVTGEADLIAWFTDSDEQYYGGEAFRAANGQIYGGVRPEVFEQLGYRTLRSNMVWSSAALRLLDDPPWEDGEDDPEQWRVFVAPIAGGRMAYIETIESVEDALGLVPWVVTVVGAAILSVTLVVGLALGWRQQRRLDRITIGMQNLAKGRFDQPIAPAQARDDLDDVMVGVDAAAAQLSQSFDHLRRFSQNMAHELRTPLARLHGKIDALPVSDQTEAALAEADEVIRVFEAVQRIARLSQGGARTGFAQVDLAQIAHMMQELYADVAEENGQSLHLDLRAPAQVQGDQQLIAQMVSNLIENALRHSGDGSQITVQAHGRALSVLDTGQGVAPDQIDRMFTPFERLQADRKGTGLGLALVKAIAEYHRATLSAQSEAGFAVSIRFPEMPAQNA